MSKKLLWRIGFLGVTVLAVVMELIAAWDGSSDTEPWTHLIGQYVPGPLTLVVIVLGARWLWDHFVHEYKVRKKPVPDAKPLSNDAQNRAFRTLLQGAVAAAGTAGLSALVQVLADLQTSGPVTVDARTTLVTGGVGALTAALTAGLSYLHRRVLDPSKLPSALPPG